MTLLSTPNHLRPMPDLKDYMTTSDAAKSLKLTLVSVRRLAKKGRLDGVLLGGRWLVTKESVTRYKKSVAGKSPNDPSRGN